MEGYETDFGLRGEGVRRGVVKNRRGQKWAMSKVGGVKSGSGRIFSLGCILSVYKNFTQSISIS